MQFTSVIALSFSAKMQPALAIGVLVSLASLCLFSPASATFCRAPPRISNGGHSGGYRTSFRVWTSVTYRCNHGYTLLGRSQLTCVSSRYNDHSSSSYDSSSSSSDSSSGRNSVYWNRGPPKCIRKCTGIMNLFLTWVCPTWASNK